MQNAILNFFPEKVVFGRFWLVFPTLGSILGAQTRPDCLGHGRSYRQARPKEYFGPWEGRDWSRHDRATV